MQANYLKCTFCLQEFNTDKRIPYILIECGHSICQKCLSANIGKQDRFECPEDQAVINLDNRTLNGFPKNQALLNMIGQKTDCDSHSSKKSLRNSSLRDSGHLSKNLSDRLSRNTNQNSKANSDYISGKQRKIHNSVKDRTLSRRLITTNSNSFSDDNQEEICLKHHMRLEVICTEFNCQKKVCYKCCLFGEHSVSL